MSEQGGTATLWNDKAPSDQVTKQRLVATMHTGRVSPDERVGCRRTNLQDSQNRSTNRASSYCDTTMKYCIAAGLDERYCMSPGTLPLPRWRADKATSDADQE